MLERDGILRATNGVNPGKRHEWLDPTRFSGITRVVEAMNA